MPKRFIDSAIWSDPWFQDLENIDKLIWIYLFTNCCIVGTWEFNPKRAEFDLGKKINWESVKKCFSEKILFTEKYWIIKNFIKQQYPNILKKPKAPLHVAVLSEIEKKCLKFDLNSLSIVYEYTIDSVQVKEKVIVKEEVISFKEEIQDPLWVTSFEEFIRISEPVWDKLMSDWEFISILKEQNPKTLVKKSMMKSWETYWGEEKEKKGWKNKVNAYKIAKREAIKEKNENFNYEINWRLTIQKTLSLSRVPVIGNMIDDEAVAIQMMNRGR